MAIDYVGWTVAARELEGFRLTVVEARAVLCEFCSAEGNMAADFTIDASPLGPGGYSASYCAAHMRLVVEVYGPASGDVWSPPAR